MAKVKEVLHFLDRLAPMHMKMDFDNVGLLVGRGTAEVSKILVALDVTQGVIDEAKEMGAELIVGHHPLTYTPMKAIVDNDLCGNKILDLIEHKIATICMHTNLDSAEGGINDVLAYVFGLRDTMVLNEQGKEDGKPYGLGRAGYLEAPMSLADFLPRAKATVKTKGLRYYDAGRPVHKVGVMGGSGTNELAYAVQAGCDTYVVGEVKYNAFLDAREYGINLIEADHFCTESLILAPLAKMLVKEFPEISVSVSKTQGQALDFFV